MRRAASIIFCLRLGGGGPSLLGATAVDDRIFIGLKLGMNCCGDEDGCLSAGFTGLGGDNTLNADLAAIGSDMAALAAISAVGDVCDVVETTLRLEVT